MLKFLFTLFLVVSLTSAASAQHLMGTDIDRPTVDIGCDAAEAAQDFTDEETLCKQAAQDYDDIVGRLAGYKHLKDSEFIIQEMMYNEAACLYQVSFAYKELGDDVQGQNYAVASFNVFDTSRMHFWAKINAAANRRLDDLSPIDYKKEPDAIKKKLALAISAKDVWLMQHFGKLMNNVNHLYPGTLNSPNPHTTDI